MDRPNLVEILLLCAISCGVFLADVQATEETKTLAKRFIDYTRHAWDCHPGCRMYCLPSCKQSCCLPGAPNYTPDLFPKLIQYQASIPKPKAAPMACAAPCSITCYPKCDEGCCSRKQPPAPFTASVLPSRVKVVKPTRKNVCAVGCSPLCAPGCNPSCCYMRSLIERRKQNAARLAQRYKPKPHPVAKKPSNPNDGKICVPECKKICKPICKFECCDPNYQPPPPPRPPPPPPPPRRPPPPPPPPRRPAYQPHRYAPPPPPPPAPAPEYPPAAPEPRPYAYTPLPEDTTYFGGYQQQAQPLPALPPALPQCASPCSEKCAPFCTPECCLDNSIHMNHYIVAPYTTNVPEVFHATPKPQPSQILQPPPSYNMHPAANINNPKPKAPKIVCHGYCRGSCSSICPSFCCDRENNINWDKRTNIKRVSI